MMRLLTIGVAMLILLGQAGPVPPALAAGPQDRVKATLDAVAGVFHDPTLQAPDAQAERKRRVRDIINDSFHFDEMAPVSLGPYWDRLTPVQQEEFVRLFGEFFGGVYSRLVLRFLGDRKTTYVSESVEGDRAIVETVLLGDRGERLSVEYQLVSRGGRWGMVDVRLDGVSLVTNYRSQFSKIIRTSTYDTLVERIRRKVGNP